MEPAHTNLKPDWSSLRHADWKTKLLYGGPIGLFVASFLTWIKVDSPFGGSVRVSAMDADYGKGLLLAAVVMLVLGHLHARGVRAAKGLLAGVAIVAGFIVLAAFSDARDVVDIVQSVGVPIHYGAGGFVAAVAVGLTIFAAFSRRAGSLVWSPQSGTDVFTRWADPNRSSGPGSWPPPTPGSGWVPPNHPV